MAYNVTDSTRAYPTYDGNGNVSEYLDASSAITAHYEYDANTMPSGTRSLLKPPGQKPETINTSSPPNPKTKPASTTMAIDTTTPQQADG